MACRSNSAGFSARGVGKVEPGSENILGVGLDFEHRIRICPAHSRLGVGLEKLRGGIVELMVSIQFGIEQLLESFFFISIPAQLFKIVPIPTQLSAYANHELKN